jgi:hypothetical protein
MVLCNRCGTVIASGTTRGLKVHRLYCTKSGPMKFRQPDSRVPKLKKQCLTVDLDGKVCQNPLLTHFMQLIACPELRLGIITRVQCH